MYSTENFFSSLLTRKNRQNTLLYAGFKFGEKTQKHELSKAQTRILRVTSEERNCH